jgi:hypothetical protein
MQARPAPAYQVHKHITMSGDEIRKTIKIRFAECRERGEKEEETERTAFKHNENNL